MKKLFIALMAVLVLASCGEKKKAVATPGDVVMVMVDVLNTASTSLDNATSGEDVVKAMEAFAASVKNIETEYADVMEANKDLEEADLAEKYPEATKAMEAAQVKFMESMMNVDSKFQLTEEQEERIGKAFEAM